MQAPEAIEEHPSGLRQLSLTAFKAASQLVQAGRAAMGHEGADGGAAPAAVEGQPPKVEVTQVGMGMTLGTVLTWYCWSCRKGALEGWVHKVGKGLRLSALIYMADVCPVWWC